MSSSPTDGPAGGGIGGGGSGGDGRNDDRSPGSFLQSVARRPVGTRRVSPTAGPQLPTTIVRCSRDRDQANALGGGVRPEAAAEEPGSPPALEELPEPARDHDTDKERSRDATTSVHHRRADTTPAVSTAAPTSASQQTSLAATEVATPAPSSSAAVRPLSAVEEFFAVLRARLRILHQLALQPPYPMALAEWPGFVARAHGRQGLHLPVQWQLQEVVSAFCRVTICNGCAGAQVVLRCGFCTVCPRAASFSTHMCHLCAQRLTARDKEPGMHLRAALTQAPRGAEPLADARIVHDIAVDLARNWLTQAGGRLDFQRVEELVRALTALYREQCGGDLVCSQCNRRLPRP